MVGPLWEHEGNANDLKRYVREHIKELALCTVWEQKKRLIIPVLLSARVTEEPPPREGRDERLLPIKQVRESAKLRQNEEFRRVKKQGTNPRVQTKRVH